MRRRVWGAVVVALALPSCAADRDDSLHPTIGTTATTPSTIAGETGSTTAGAAAWFIQSFLFVVDVPAVAGEPIEVINLDGADHTLTAEDGSFEAYVESDGTATLTIEQPGSHAVWCRIHPDMRATVVVAPVP